MRAQRSALSAIPQHGAMRLSDIPAATAKQGNTELLSCLILVAPSGMTEEDRTNWLRVARQELSGIPSDLLERACAKVRRTCRFASEIIPTIFAEVEGEWERRKRDKATNDARHRNRDAPRLESPPCVDVKEMRDLIRKISGSLTA